MSSWMGPQRDTIVQNVLHGFAICRLSVWLPVQMFPESVAIGKVAFLILRLMLISELSIMSDSMHVPH